MISFWEGLGVEVLVRWVCDYGSRKLWVGKGLCVLLAPLKGKN